MSGGAVQRRSRIQTLVLLPSLLRLAVPLLRDRRVPFWQRASAVGLILLVLSPLDAIGDIPVVGQFWDFTLAVTILEAFIRMAPAEVVNEHIVELGLQRKFPLR
jgi:uncharacterized membrane protein YkvA (DUF1232 family)